MLPFYIPVVMFRVVFFLSFSIRNIDNPLQWRRWAYIPETTTRQSGREAALIGPRNETMAESIAQNEYDLLFGHDVFRSITPPPGRDALSKMLNDPVLDADVAPCQGNSPGSLANKTFGEIRKAASQCADSLRAIGE
uniref:Uncharacterized protein n=1 Tax=Candidatus Kentrum sp. TC TaxID=2126339 RepID=A0A450YW20_9GAMM|nr:MAG: hypothetical protein BECKTC1821E_GA0114239_10544 [Candidatus Kentron sp. TC]